MSGSPINEPPSGKAEPRRRGGQGEALAPPVAAVVVAIGLYALLPESLLLGPRLLVPAVEVVLLGALVATNPRRLTRQTDLPQADWRFSQDENDDTVVEVSAGSSARSGWIPQFVDYLYVSVTNSSAFSPTDTMPLTTREGVDERAGDCAADQPGRRRASAIQCAPGPWRNDVTSRERVCAVVFVPNVLA